MDSNSPPVVVGIDGSDRALGAARWAAPEAVNRLTRLRLVYAATDDGAGARDRACRALDAAYALVTGSSPNVEVETASVTGTAENVLLEESEHASMVCIGASDRRGPPLDATAASLIRHAKCPLAIIRERLDDDGTDVVAVVLDDAPDNDAVVHRAMEEGRLRHATVRQIDRRANSWARRFPDVHVQTVAAGCGPRGHDPSESAPAQLAVVGRADAERIGELVTPNCHPIVGFPDCSVLLVRN